MTIQPATVSPLREVPASIPRPHYVGRLAPDPFTGDDVQSHEIIEKMRIAGRLAAQATHAAAAAIQPGVTTDDLDQVVHEYLIEHHAYPSTLGYPDFQVLLHVGQRGHLPRHPRSRPLEYGDIVKIDVTAYIGGVHGDTCATFFCGEVDEASRLLTERTQEALARAIKAVKPGLEVNVIGRVIESYVKRSGTAWSRSTPATAYTLPFIPAWSSRTTTSRATTR